MKEKLIEFIVTCCHYDLNLGEAVTKLQGMEIHQLKGLAQHLAHASPLNELLASLMGI